MYRVKEIFLTKQGEGYHTGRDSVFVRFSGCNLWSGLEKDRDNAICNWCDTDFVGTDGINGGRYTKKEIVNVMCYGLPLKHYASLQNMDMNKNPKKLILSLDKLFKGVKV